jgi:hypothetical protein
MNNKQVQAILNPNPDGTSLGSRLRPCRADGVFRSVGDIDGCTAKQDHAVGNLIEDHIMTAQRSNLWRQAGAAHYAEERAKKQPCRHLVSLFHDDGATEDSVKA